MTKKGLGQRMKIFRDRYKFSKRRMEARREENLAAIDFTWEMGVLLQKMLEASLASKEVEDYRDFKYQGLLGDKIKSIAAEMKAKKYQPYEQEENAAQEFQRSNKDAAAQRWRD